jgi:hypothetical protein
MSLGFALALTMISSDAAQSTGWESEAKCIPDALMAQVDAKRPLEVEGPTAACKARYGWTAEETAAALAVANATGTLMGDAHRLQTIGVDLDLIERTAKELSPANVAALGIYGDTKDAEHLVAENSARIAIANLIVPRFKEDIWIPLQMAVADYWIQRNTIHAFTTLRAQRH